MKLTTKDALIGIAFAIGYTIAAFVIGGSLIHTYLAVFILSSPLMIGVLGIPFYYIFKKDRGWQFCVAVAVTLFILGTLIWIPAIWSVFTLGGLDTFFYLLLILACYMLPSVLDGLIYTAKRFWQWLGNRSAL